MVSISDHPRQFVRFVGSRAPLIDGSILRPPKRRQDQARILQTNLALYANTHQALVNPQIGRAIHG